MNPASACTPVCEWWLPTIPASASNSKFEQYSARSSLFSFVLALVNINRVRGASSELRRISSSAFLRTNLRKTRLPSNETASRVHPWIQAYHKVIVNHTRGSNPFRWPRHPENYHHPLNRTLTEISFGHPFPLWKTPSPFRRRILLSNRTKSNLKVKGTILVPQPPTPTSHHRSSCKESPSDPACDQRNRCKLPTCQGFYNPGRQVVGTCWNSKLR